MGTLFKTSSDHFQYDSTFNKNYYAKITNVISNIVGKEGSFFLSNINQDEDKNERI